jgi:hypothetical protein
MKYPIAFTFSLLLVFGLSSLSVAKSQDSARKVRRAISGRITDPNGALVVGATITIVRRSSHAPIVKRSNRKGQYAADLEPDTYDVTVTAPGFKTVMRSTGVVGGSHSYMDFVLYPGELGSPGRIIP